MIYALAYVTIAILLFFVSVVRFGLPKKQDAFEAVGMLALWPLTIALEVWGEFSYWRHMRKVKRNGR